MTEPVMTPRIPDNLSAVVWAQNDGRVGIFMRPETVNYDDLSQLEFPFQVIPSTYKEIANAKKAHQLLVHNLVDAISKLTIQHQELIIENAILKQENSILRAQNNHQRKIQWQRAGQ